MAGITRIVSLYSGSKGNCVFVRGEHSRILIDAGKSAKALCTALEEIGESIEDVDAIFITHEHTDHVSALQTLSKRYRIPIHAAMGTARALDKKFDGLFECIVPHKPVFSEELYDFTVDSFRTSHDSASAVGYKITDADGFSVGIMTDTGIVTNAAAKALCGCYAVVLESNHDREMLANGPYPDHLKERVGGKLGHLSNDISAKFASYLSDNGTERFLLAHLSEENNTPSLALETASAALAGKTCSVLVADQYAPVRLI